MNFQALQPQELLYSSIAWKDKNGVTTTENEE